MHVSLKQYYSGDSLPIYTCTRFSPPPPPPHTHTYTRTLSSLDACNIEVKTDQTTIVWFKVLIQASIHIYRTKQKDFKILYHDCFELPFASLRNSSESSTKQIFRDTLGNFSCFITNMYVVCCVIISFTSSRRFLWVHSTYHYFVEDQKDPPSLPPSPPPPPLNYSHLHPDLALWLTLSGSNFPCLEQISMLSKMFEPLKFDCNINAALKLTPHLYTSALCMRYRANYHEGFVNIRNIDATGQIKVLLRKEK